MMKPTAQKLLASILGMLLLCACDTQPSPQNVTPVAVSPVTRTSIPPEISIPTNTNTPLLPLPVGTHTTPTPLPRATPTKLFFDEEAQLNHPLSIEHMRQGEYPGSVITFEQELEPGGNYHQYYVSYTSDDLRIYALMTIPNENKSDEGWPAIIFNHGYIPPDVYRTNERYGQYVDALASNGYIVFKPDYRGNSFSEGEARGAYGYPDYTIDVLNALASVKAYEDVDPERIGMWGHSMGGYLTLRCMVISEDIKVGVIWAGVVAPYADMVYEWPGQTYETPELANSWRTTLAANYGTPSQNPAFWDAISANSYLTEISGPIELHHAVADLEVPIAFSTRLYRQLVDLDIPVELYTYENDNHNLSNSFDVAMRRTIEFFNLYLK